MAYFKKIMRFVFISITIMALLSCATQKKVNYQSELIKQMATFQQNISEAYFIVGFECYKLAEDYKNKGDMVKAKEFSERAKMYRAMYDELNRSAKQNSELLKPKE